MKIKKRKEEEKKREEENKEKENNDALKLDLGMRWMKRRKGRWR